jgi:hypothetical protein
MLLVEFLALRNPFFFGTTNARNSEDCVEACRDFKVGSLWLQLV